MMEYLSQLDNRVFIWVNQTFSHPSLDYFFATLTRIHQLQWFKWIVAPLLIFFLLFHNYRNALKLIIALGLTLAITDTLGYRVLKENIYRERPHMRKELNPIVRVPYAPQSSSFPSNHAINTTALVVIVTYYIPQLLLLGWVLIALMAYSRVYVGVHFMSDVLVGILIGCLVAILMRDYIFKKLSLFRRAL